ncbi:hypothetical protein E4T56_gene17434 [Termitomyces sp. T112]|nr:hypothetical protein E4T56_gene17434 [Termitomyces sp. T112]
MTGSSKDFRVAIVGGGMCGLVCAIGLAKAGVHVETFEQATSFQEVGAGVSIGPNILFFLKDLGVLQAVLSKTNEQRPTMRAMRFISAAGPHELIYDYPATPDDVGLGVYRNAL